MRNSYLFLLGFALILLLPGSVGAQTEKGSSTPCFEGATCCADGRWACNSSDGSSTCALDGLACELRCCDAAREPGAFDNPPCFEGASCCASGEWQCNDADGSSTCVIDSRPCEQCCDPLGEPGQHGNEPCLEGANCCANGEWTCNAEGGNSTCNVAGVVCATPCCDPRDEPGIGQNPPCIEGATCCGTGEWQCNSGDGTSTCATDGDPCQLQCCDPRSEPGRGNNPPCFEGASCCPDGNWQCNDPTGQPTCDAPGIDCERCCDPLGEPGRFGNPICFEGATCCADGEWQCNDGAGQSTCDVDGVRCERCCDPLEQPGLFGNPLCFEGATCCTNGEWQCNDGAGASTCEVDGLVCGPPCCNPDDRPDCADGASCCGDGRWLCNDKQGNSTCPDGEVGEECPRRCGGTHGIPCEAGEFCKVPDGACVDGTGVCLPKPDACPDVFDPVCGCDGETYGNDCEADAAGIPIAHRGPCDRVCGGIAGIGCPPGEYCQFRNGECCCDFEGVCQPLPEACPLVCQPVCGCDGQTYGNPCLAARAGVSIQHFGACDLNPREVQGVLFEAPDHMSWKKTPAALGYNVYVKRVLARPPEDYGHCVFSGLKETSTVAPGRPQPKILWIYQVTALFEGGEGPMGILDRCRTREPAEPCTCTLPADSGPCEAAIPRWFHNWQTGQCEEFIYGGCEGNANNFGSLEQCQAACENSCALPPDVGPCDAVIPRWFHNRVTGRCEEFIWGGCGGNANNFETREECENACVCSLPADVGPCEALVPRFFFNSHLGQCEPFIWGGCGGNANNFETAPECERACLDVCGLPPDPGPCDAAFERWYHNADTGECETFVWGGCGGNGNQFESLEACRAHCDTPL